MDQHTSTELARILHAALTAAGSPFASTMGSAPDPMRESSYPSDVKGRILSDVLTEHGPGFLLAVGQHARRVPPTPVLSVLTNAQPPAVTAEKWTRLERYHHSSHRTLLEEVTPCRIAIRRASRSTPPSLAENLLIAGCLFALMAPEGYLEIAALRLRREDLPGAELPSGMDAACFAVSWTEHLEVPHAASLAEQTRSPPDLPSLLASDVSRRWSLAEAARTLALSPRSLQRRLALEGKTFSSVVRSVRMGEAARLLADPTAGLADIGYCCGYADQAHFQRDFVRANRLTPGAYRKIIAEGTHRHA